MELLGHPSHKAEQDAGEASGGTHCAALVGGRREEGEAEGDPRPGDELAERDGIRSGESGRDVLLGAQL